MGKTGDRTKACKGNGLVFRCFPGRAGAKPLPLGISILCDVWAELTDTAQNSVR